MTTRHPPLSHVPPTGCHPMDNGNLDVTKMSRRICVHKLSDVSELWAKPTFACFSFECPKVARSVSSTHPDFIHSFCTGCGVIFHRKSSIEISHIPLLEGKIVKNFSIISAQLVYAVRVQPEGCASRVDQSSLLSPSRTTARGWMACKFPWPSKIHWCSGG